MGLSILCMSVSAFICLLAPLIIAAVMIAKHRGSWKDFVLGIIVFSMAQLLIRIPILNALEDSVGYNMFRQLNPLLYIIILAFTAGLFEEGGRLFGVKMFLSHDETTWDNALVFGLGHGGVEAFALVGLKYAGLIADTMSGKNTAAILGTPAYTYLVGGAERILAVILHIGMTMLVFYAVRKKKPLFFLYALLVHTFIDCYSYIFGLNANIWLSEGSLAVIAALAIALIVKIKPAFRDKIIETGDTI